MEHHNYDCDCESGWKMAHERLLLKVKDQLDLLEEPILSREMSGVTLHKILTKLIRDEEKRTSASTSSSSPQSKSQLQSLSSSSSTGKNDSAQIFTTLTAKNQEQKENNKKVQNSDSDSDSDIEIIEMTFYGVDDEKIEESQNKEKTCIKRTLNLAEADEKSCKKIKSIHNQNDSISSTNVKQNPNEEEEKEEKEPQVNKRGKEEEEADNGEQVADEAKEQEANEQEDEDEKGSTFDLLLTDTEKEIENAEDDQTEDFFAPIFYPNVASNFWSTQPNEENPAAQKLVIHNYPQKLGEEIYPDYKSRFGSDLWFLVNNNSKFSYYKLEDLTRKLKLTKRPKLWLQLQTSDFQNEQLQSFLSEFGKFVTHFTFERRNKDDENESENENKKLTQEQFSSLIFEKLHNVEYLVVDENFISSSTSLSDHDKEEEKQRRPQLGKLSKLKKIQFINSKFTFPSDFIEPILKSAPNLKFIQNLPLKFVDLLISLGKLDQIKSVSMEMNRPDSYGSRVEYTKDFETLIKSGIRLKKLVTPVYFTNSKGYVTLILMNYQSFFQSKARRNSLRELQIEPTRLLDWSEFGPLENLSTLQINIFGFAAHYSNELQLHKVFPRLKTLVINYLPGKNRLRNYSKLSERSHVFDKYFPPNIFIPIKSFQFVTELKLMGSFPAGCMKNLRVLLPGISTLTWNCELSKCREILPFCWLSSLWPGLTTLRFEIDLGERRNNPDFDFEYADSALLGLPEEICKDLRNGLGIWNADQAEKNPSILDLKKLERFEIEVQEPSCAEKDAETRIFSELAGSHGFDEMKRINPKFQLEITFHSGCSSKYAQSVQRDLQPLLPFVNH